MSKDLVKISLKISSLFSQELILFKKDQSSEERTLPKACLRLGFKFRDFTIFERFKLGVLEFGWTFIVKWSERPNGANFCGLS